MQFALIVAPLTACTGLAIDGGRAFLTRYELASALDAAALAVGSTEGEQLELEALADLFVARNFQVADSTPVETALVLDGDTVTLTGSATIDTYFMPLFGIPTVTVSAESEVRRGGANVEVALILDTTGSMAGSRIAALREAAAELVDIVVTDEQEPFYSKIAIVPYSMAVNVGEYAQSVRGAITGAVDITAASWRNGTTKTHSTVGWRDGSVKTISAATWKVGSAQTIKGATKATQAVISVDDHSFSNGDFIYISGVSGMTQLNGNKYLVANASEDDFKIKNPTSGLYINSSAYTAFSNPKNGKAQECFNALCEVRVTTSSSHGFANTDRIYINGVAGMTELNNVAGVTWSIAGVASSTFMVTGSGPTFSNYTAGGTASECFTTTCEIRVETSTSHGFDNNDRVYVTGVSGFTGVSNAAGATWGIGGVAATTFILPGTIGPNLGVTGTGGTSTECFTATCQIRVTANGHGISDSGYVSITGVGGMAINTTGNNSWQVSNVSSNTYVLGGTIGPNFADYTSGGSSWCLTSGCEYYRFTNASGTPATRIFRVSTCATERTGSDAFTDAAPNAALVGRNYPATGNPCPAANPMQPLTSDDEVLQNRISNMNASGSTGGHIGVAWGWYLLSPNFAYLFPEESQPAAYDDEDLIKVAVLMTDGEYNSSYCNGVISRDSTAGSGATSDHINCNATNGHAFAQATQLCAAMRDQGIVIYTVGFEIVNDQRARDLVNGCATDAEHVYLADNRAELTAAFADIAQAISQLRLSR